MKQPKCISHIYSTLMVMVFILSMETVFAQKPPFEGMKNFIRPAIKEGGFKMDEYFLWCPSVIKVGDIYHMFASAWPVQYSIAGWTTYSKCIRATSKNLLGPYTFQEVVLEKRAGFWDSERVHNVKIVKSGSKFILYYISTANEIGNAEATSITGPWTRSEKMVSFSNPAPLIHPDGHVYILGRLSVKIEGKDVRVARAAKAVTYQGPYTAVAPEVINLFPNDYQLEDPTIWWANNQYNVICTDFGGKATGIGKSGVQYFSRDGINYQLVTTEPVSTKTIAYDDGTFETFKRVERPFVYTDENGVVIAYFLACMTPEGKGRIIAHPVDHYIPGKSVSKVKGKAK